MRSEARHGIYEVLSCCSCQMPAGHALSAWRCACPRLEGRLTSLVQWLVQAPLRAVRAEQLLRCCRYYCFLLPLTLPVAYAAVGA